MSKEDREAPEKISDKWNPTRVIPLTKEVTENKRRARTDKVTESKRRKEKIWIHKLPVQ